MGNCLCCSNENYSKNKKFDDNLCQIKTKQGIIGNGFFSTIIFPNEKTKSRILITNDSILNEEDFHSGNIIQLYFKKRNRIIYLEIDDDRKCYSIDEYRISVIEIKEKDNLNFVSFIDLDSSSTNLTNAFLFYNGNNNKDKKYFLDNINYENLNKPIFNCSINNSNKDSYDFIGCPIILDDKIIGIIIRKDKFNKYIGILLSPAINNYFSFQNTQDTLLTNYNSFTQNKDIQIKVIFHDMDHYKDYVINTNYNFMFGELIIYFYLESGLDFDESIRFSFNCKEISSYSCETLINLNIKNNSIISFGRKKLQLQFNLIWNIIFHLKQGIIIIANPLMSVKELIIKFCQVFRYPFYEAIQNYVFIYNTKTINFMNCNLKEIGLKDGAKIDIYEKNE